MQPCDTGAGGSDSDDAGLPRTGRRNRPVIGDQEGAAGEDKQRDNGEDTPDTSEDECDDEGVDEHERDAKKSRNEKASEHLFDLHAGHSGDDDDEEDEEDDEEENTASELSVLTEPEDEGLHAALDNERDMEETPVFQTNKEAMQYLRRSIAQTDGSRRVQNRSTELSEHEQRRIMLESLEEMSDEALEGKDVTGMDIEESEEEDAVELEAPADDVADEDRYLSEEAEGYISQQDDNLREHFAEEVDDLDPFEDDEATLVGEGEFVPHAGRCVFFPTTSYRVYNLPGNQTGEQGVCQRVVWRLYVGLEGNTSEGYRAVQLRLGEAVYVPLGAEVADTLPSMGEEEMQRTTLFDVVLSECLIDVYLHSSTQHRGPVRNDGTYRPHWNWRGKLYSHVFAEWNKAERDGKEEVDIAVSSNESLKLKRGAQAKLRVRDGKEARECLLQLILNSLETAKVGLHKLRASAGEASGGCPKTYFHLLGEAHGVRQ